MKKIKVLHSIGRLRTGGAENVVMNYLRYMNPQKYEHNYLVFDDSTGNYENEAKRLGAKIIRIPRPELGYFDFISNLYYVLKNYGPYDVIHAHMMFNNGLVLFVGWLLHIPNRISHAHSTGTGKKENFVYKVYMHLMRLGIKFFSTTFLACEEEAGEFLYGKKLFSKKGIIIKNGINLSKYSYNSIVRKRTKEKLNLENKKIIGHIGRFSPEKNHTFLVKVFFEIQKLQDDTVLLLVGDGKTKKEIEVLVNQMKVEKKVIFLGVRDDVNELLQAIDLLIFPSLYEGLPLTLIEAQAAGLKCIVSNTISSKVKVTNEIVFLDLNLAPIEWAKTAINAFGYQRKNVDSVIKEAGYSVYMNCKQLESIYGEIH